MDKEVKRCIEELELAHKCVIILSHDSGKCLMKVFFDNGSVSEDVILGTRDDNKYRILINMRKYFRQG